MNEYEIALATGVVVRVKADWWSIQDGHLLVSSWQEVTGGRDLVPIYDVAAGRWASIRDVAKCPTGWTDLGGKNWRSVRTAGRESERVRGGYCSWRRDRADGQG